MSGTARAARWMAPLVAVLALAVSVALAAAATPKAGKWSGAYAGASGGVSFSVGGKHPKITGFTFSGLTCFLQVNKTIPVKDSGRFVYSGAARTAAGGTQLKIEGKFTSKTEGWVKIPRIGGGNHECVSDAPKLEISRTG